MVVQFISTILRKLQKKVQSFTDSNFVYGCIMSSFWLPYPLWSNLPTPKEVPIHLATITFAIYGVLVMIFDKLGAMEEYKLKRTDGQEPYKQKPYREILQIVTFNHLLHVMFYLFLWIPLVDKGLHRTLFRPNPLFVIIDLVFYYVIAETIFTLGHWIIHSPLLYKYVHSRHHQIHDNQGMGGWYMGVIDFCVEIIIPIYVGLWVTGTLHDWFPRVFFWQTGHWLSTTVYLVGSVVNNIHVHSGYHFWGLTNPDKHQTHHIHPGKNYGDARIDKRLGSYSNPAEVFESDK